MDITTAQYVSWYNELNDTTETSSINVTLSDGSTINVPISEANRHYAEIMRQVEDGTLTIEDAE